MHSSPHGMLIIAFLCTVLGKVDPGGNALYVNLGISTHKILSSSGVPPGIRLTVKTGTTFDPIPRYARYLFPLIRLIFDLSGVRSVCSRIWHISQNTFYSHQLVSWDYSIYTKV